MCFQHHIMVFVARKEAAVMVIKKVNKVAVSVCVLVIIISAVLMSIAVTSIIRKFNHDADITFASTLFSSDVIAPSNYFKQVTKVVKEPVIEVPLISERLEARETEAPVAQMEEPTDVVSTEDGDIPEGTTPVSVDVGAANVEPDYIGKGYVYVRDDGCIVYHIVYGDTLWAISQRIGVSVWDLGEYNQIPDINLIYAGVDLLIPPDKYPGYDVLFGLSMGDEEEIPDELPGQTDAALPVETFSVSDDEHPDEEPE
jgi:hypothetical protein